MANWVCIQFFVFFFLYSFLMKLSPITFACFTKLALSKVFRLSYFFQYETTSLHPCCGMYYIFIHKCDNPVSSGVLFQQDGTISQTVPKYISITVWVISCPCYFPFKWSELAFQIKRFSFVGVFFSVFGVFFSLKFISTSPWSLMPWRSKLRAVSAIFKQ